MAQAAGGDLVVAHASRLAGFGRQRQLRQSGASGPHGEEQDQRGTHGAGGGMERQSCWCKDTVLQSHVYPFGGSDDSFSTCYDEGGRKKGQANRK
ncbi:hypothetical protein JaAD80_29025 [Janthinobacterium sp. AD80]|nr:hypothetical protein JaAD80_29025 [Janthinobacterium sp. AD80]